MIRLENSCGSSGESVCNGVFFFRTRTPKNGFIYWVMRGLMGRWPAELAIVHHKM